MLSATLSSGTSSKSVRHFADTRVPQPKTDESKDHIASQRMVAALKLLNDVLEPQRRMVRAGDSIYQAGERFETLYVLNSGFVKIVALSPDGREQVVGLKFRGD